MGIYDRDYYRGDSRSFIQSSRAPVCFGLIWANVIVYVLQLLSGDRLTDWLSADLGSVLHGQVWRVVTYAFCHDPRGLLHILFNMLFLYWFGPELERMYGPKEFLRFYLAAAVVAAAAYLGLAWVIKNPAPMIGASGAVMGVTVLYATYYPHHKLLLFFVFPVEVRWLVLIFVIFDLHPVLLALGGGQVTSEVAHAAHLGGLAYGFLYRKLNLRFDRFFSDVRFTVKRRSKPSHLKVYREPDQEPYEPPSPGDSGDLSHQVDAILAKISTEGEQSLSEEERKILMQASQKYRNRRGDL